MPKIALISDIHGNLPALEAVLEVLEGYSPDLWICLGDLVGYGPNPSECINIVKEREMLTVLGNHDAGVVGKLTIKHFRNPNQRLITMSQEMLSKDEFSWLSELPLTLSEGDVWVASHSSPIKPMEWGYLDSAIKARKVLSEIEASLCFVGHTHVPALVSSQIGNMLFTEGNKHFINPGSVGQSRDNDFRASCCFVDTDNWIIENIRVEYNTEKVVTDLHKLGFTREECHQLLRY
tara:strand:+ start:1713 stop:2417 length:705 start_codon:yes stop_codon:yes gene_type:complete